MSPIARRSLIFGGAALLLSGATRLERHAVAQSPEKENAHKRDVRLAWADSEYEPLLALCRATYFAANGLNVAIAPVSTGAESILALSSGRVDAAVAPLLDWLPAFFAEPQAQPAARLICGVRGGFYRLLVRRNAGIARMSNLKGKRIGVSAFDSASRVFLSIRLRRKGLHPIDSVEWITMQTQNMAFALNRGEVDAVVVHDPEGWQILQKTRGVSWNMLDSLSGAERNRVDLVLGVADARLRSDPGFALAMRSALSAARDAYPKHAMRLADHWSKMPDAPADLAGMIKRQTGGKTVSGHALRIQIEQYVDEFKLIGSMKDSDDAAKFARRITYQV